MLKGQMLMTFIPTYKKSRSRRMIKVNFSCFAHSLNNMLEMHISLRLEVADKSQYVAIEFTPCVDVRRVYQNLVN